MLQCLREDIDTILDRDPAARNFLEVLLCYPGLHARWCHYLTHFLWQRSSDNPLPGLGSTLSLLARLLAQAARTLTGIEIHPAARIGRRLFIDHGMGVVIGETAVIGDDVTLYHGVTLGGTGKDTGKRHPTLEKNVFVGAGASILGNITIGAYTVIGANAVVLRDAPANSTLLGNPARTLSRGNPHLTGLLSNTDFFKGQDI